MVEYLANTMTWQDEHVDNIKYLYLLHIQVNSDFHAF